MRACLPSNQCTVPENTKLLQDQQILFLCQRNLIFRSYPHCNRYTIFTIENISYYNHVTTKECQTGTSFPWSCGLLLEIHQKFSSFSKTTHSPNASWCNIWLDTDLQSSIHHPKRCPHISTILHYPITSKWYIVYMDTSDDACGAQLSQ